MGMVDTYSDEQLEEALIKTNGQPSKAADLLSVSYQSVYKRIRRNPELLDFQRSTRQKTFQDISNFQVAAVLAGIVKTPEVYEDGSVRRDENGKVEYRDAIVGINARLEYGSRLMTLFKSDEGIKEETDVSIKTAVDTSKLTDDTLNDLMAALKNDEK